MSPLHDLSHLSSKHFYEIDAILCYPYFANEETDSEKGIDLLKVALWQSQADFPFFKNLSIVDI